MFIDNGDLVKAAIQRQAIGWLDEASGEIVARTIQKSRRGTGKTAGAWTHKVDEAALEATVGNPDENALWEEFGTGEYALKGDGRRGGWVYRDPLSGDFYFTYGKRPSRAFHYTWKEMETPIKRMAEKYYQELSK